MGGALHRWVRWLRAPADCGGGPPRYGETGWADEVSPDQARMEAAIGPRLGGDVLHVGIGSSRIARLYRARRIDGLTVVPRELDLAPALPGYAPRLADKYRALPDGPYDWILDNNPSSWACCRRHFLALLDGYAARLKPGGRFVTELGGLAYAAPYAFGLSGRRFARLGRARGMEVEWLTATVPAWRRPTRA